MLKVCAPKASFPPRTTTTTTAAAAAATTTTTFSCYYLNVFIVARAIFKRRNPGAAEDGAEDVLGATKDGGVEVFIVKVFILSIVTCQLRTHAQHTHAPTPALR